MFYRNLYTYQKYFIETVTNNYFSTQCKTKYVGKQLSMQKETNSDLNRSVLKQIFKELIKLPIYISINILFFKQKIFYF